MIKIKLNSLFSFFFNKLENNENRKTSQTLFEKGYKPLKPITFVSD